MISLSSTISLKLRRLSGVKLALPILVSGLFAAGCATMKEEAKPGTMDFFTEEVKPILEMNCLKCHNGKVLPGRMDLTSKKGAFSLKPGGGYYLVPGKPEKSMLLEAASRSGSHRLAMPPVYLSLTPEQIESLRQWIAAGALWPDGRAGQLKEVFNKENPSRPEEAINDVLKP